MRDGFEGGGGFEQGIDGALAGGDVFDVAQRSAEPLAEKSAAHRGAGAVDGGEERALRGAPAGGAVDFQTAPGGGIDGQVLVEDVAAEGTQVREAGLLGFVQVREHGTGGEDGGIVVIEAKAGAGGCAPLAMNLLPGMMS